MKTAFAILLAAAVGTVAAEPHTVVTPCTACKGERSLSLTPPNLGQHDGEIDVTPGKPFTSHRWDVKHSRCPLCKGTGRHEKWVFKVSPPEDRAADRGHSSRLRRPDVRHAVHERRGFRAEGKRILPFPGH